MDSDNGSSSEVYLDGSGLIRFIYRGKLDKTTGLDLINYAMVIVRQLQKEHRLIKVLADTREMTGFAPEARKTGELAREVIPFTKMAIVVSAFDSQTTLTSKVLTEESGLKKRIRYFATIAEALHWLGD